MTQHRTVARKRLMIAWAYGAACHVLFSISVGSMALAMFAGMSTALGRVPPPASTVANGMLLLQFPLLHSWLLTRGGGRLLRKCAPSGLGGPLATTSFAIVVSIQVALLFLLWTPTGILWWRAEGGVFVLVTALYTASWVFLGKAIADAGFAYQVGLLGWRAVAQNKPVQYPPMPATGVFRFTRQPIYLAFTLTLWTVPVWTPDQLAVALTLTAYCVAGPLLKERRFAERFGRDFEAYRKSVPYWFPRLRHKGARMDAPNGLIYDAYAREWWSSEVRWLRVLQGLTPVRLRLFAPMVQGWAGKDVLDLGCGGGFLAEALAKAGARVTGVDPSTGAIAAAIRHSEQASLSISYRVGAGEAIPTRDASFDVVVCVDVLEHVEDLAQVCREISRVLRPGGLLLFDTINRTRLAAFVMVTLGETIFQLLPPGTHDPNRFVRPSELAGALAKAGLEMGALRGLGPRGLTGWFDLYFGPFPTTAILYLGSARSLESV